MTDLLAKHGPAILKSFWETNLMLGVTLCLCFIIAFPIGILLFSLNKEYLIKNYLAYQMLNLLLGTLRSVPFLIFIFILIPLNRFLFGTSFGTMAAVLPLTLVSVSLYARYVEQALLNVPDVIVQRALSLGANRKQIVRYFLLPSIKRDLILSFTATAISVLGYSTVMGVIGAGGLGEYAYRFGYQEYDYPVMYFIVLMFICYVFILQSLGYFLANRFAR
ncbi:methionine ABC transporter permease [Streptococcus phocae subsp. salmonis]